MAATIKALAEVRNLAAGETGPRLLALRQAEGHLFEALSDLQAYRELCTDDPQAINVSGESR